MFKGKSFLDYTNLFSPNKYEKNNNIILKYFQQLKKLRSYCNICGNYRKLKIPKLFSKNDYVFPIICNKCRYENEKIFKQDESVDIIKILSLI